MTEKIYLDWTTFHQDMKSLCSQIKQSGDYNKIVAISRGGLLPAGIISYELDIRNTAVINIATYINGSHLQMDKFSGCESAGIVDEKTLIVDDLSDSGQTFRLLRQQFPSAKFVTVYAKPAGEKEADIYARKLPDSWIVFPWDVE